MTIEQRLRKFVTENFYITDEIRDDTLLATGGYIDSTGMLEVMSFLETEFKIRVADTEMIPENLDSVAKITRFVEKKSGAIAASA